MSMSGLLTVNWSRSPWAKSLVDFPVGGDAMQPLGIVGHLLAVLPFDCELVRFGVCGDDGGVGAALNAKFLAPSCVVENVGGLVECGPVAVGAGQLRTLGKNGHRVIVFG